MIRFKNPGSWTVGLITVLVAQLVIGLVVNGLQKIELPKVDAVILIEPERITEEGKKETVVITDQAEMNALLYAMSDATRIETDIKIAEEDCILIRMMLKNDQRVLYYHKAEHNYLAGSGVGTFRAKGKANYVKAAYHARLYLVEQSDDSFHWDAGDFDHKDFYKVIR